MRNPFPRSAILSKIFVFAERHHRGQRRKGGLPYITHPVSVAKALLGAGYTEEVAAAGLLHDVLEDTGCEYEEMIRAAGPRVTRWVVQVTDRDKGVPWKKRKMNYLAALKKASQPALAVACADKSDNIRCLIEGFEVSGKDFGRQFSGDLADKISNYNRILRVISQRYPECALLPEYERLLQRLSVLIRKCQ